MTSGQFFPVPTDFIHIPPDRQRTRIRDEDIEALADSISRLGLIHPPLIQRDGQLVAGATRVMACRHLAWTHIPVQFTDEADPRLLRAAELEENTKRRDLSWQEINDAMVEAYELYRELEPEATTTAIAARMGVDGSNLEAHVAVKRERATNTRVATAATFRTARDTVRTVQARRATAELDEHIGPVPTCTPVLHANFHDWAPAYTGKPFSVLHVDFPYGIDAQDSGSNPAGYDDSRETYLKCLRTLAVHLDAFCAPAAHCIFWFSPTLWTETREALKLLSGFQFDEVPLVWHKSDGRGIAPDPSRRPRRVSEFAFFGWRGEARLIQLRNNVFAAPISRETHAHEKAQTMLEYFLGMIVDTTSSVFDPTCGSGSALRAAHTLGATRILGLEANKEFADAARNAYGDVLEVSEDNPV